MSFTPVSNGISDPIKRRYEQHIRCGVLKSWEYSSCLNRIICDRDERLASLFFERISDCSSEHLGRALVFSLEYDSIPIFHLVFRHENGLITPEDYGDALKSAATRGHKIAVGILLKKPDRIPGRFLEEAIQNAKDEEILTLLREHRSFHANLNSKVSVFGNQEKPSFNPPSDLPFRFSGPRWRTLVSSQDIKKDEDTLTLLREHPRVQRTHSISCTPSEIVDRGIFNPNQNSKVSVFENQEKHPYNFPWLCEFSSPPKITLFSSMVSSPDIKDEGEVAQVPSMTWSEEFIRHCELGESSYFSALQYVINERRDLVKFFFNKVPDLAPAYFGWALVRSLKIDSLPTFKIVLQSEKGRIEPEDYGKALLVAVIRKKIDAIKILLKMPDRIPGKYLGLAIYKAADAGHKEAMDLLLKLQRPIYESHWRNAKNVVSERKLKYDAEFCAQKTFTTEDFNRFDTAIAIGVALDKYKDAVLDQVDSSRFSSSYFLFG